MVWIPLNLHVLKAWTFSQNHRILGKHSAFRCVKRKFYKIFLIYDACYRSDLISRQKILMKIFDLFAGFVPMSQIGCYRVRWNNNFSVWFHRCSYSFSLLDEYFTVRKSNKPMYNFFTLSTHIPSSIWCILKCSYIYIFNVALCKRNNIFPAVSITYVSFRISEVFHLIQWYRPTQIFLFLDELYYYANCNNIRFTEYLHRISSTVIIWSSTFTFHFKWFYRNCSNLPILCGMIIDICTN